MIAFAYLLIETLELPLQDLLLGSQERHPAALTDRLHPFRGSYNLANAVNILISIPAFLPYPLEDAVCLHVTRELADLRHCGLALAPVVCRQVVVSCGSHAHRDRRVEEGGGVVCLQLRLGRAEVVQGVVSGEGHVRGGDQRVVVVVLFKMYLSDNLHYMRIPNLRSEEGIVV